jgi:hypothetical protein
MENSEKVQGDLLKVALTNGEIDSIDQEFLHGSFQ